MTFQQKKFLLWLLAMILWMGFIFYNSSVPYTEQDIRPALATWIPQWLVQSLPHLEFYYGTQLVTWTMPYDFVEFFVRKGAHVASFGALAWLAIQTFRYWPVGRFRAISGGATLALLYAASDEWHQSFVAGRTGHAIDVGVDAIGILLVVIIYIIDGLVKHRKSKAYSLSRY